MHLHVPAENERRPHRLAHPPSHRTDRVVRLVAREIREQDQEFVATLAGDEIGLARTAPQPVGRLLEQRVAGVMSHRVVHDLEVVQIQVEDRHQDPGPPGPLHGQHEGLLEEHAVGEPREPVVERHLGHTGLGFLELCDVEEEAVLPDHLPFGVAEREGSVADPHDPAVGPDHPVIREIAALAGEERVALGLHLRAVVGVDHPHPHARVGPVLLGGDAEDLLDLRAHVRRDLAVVRVDDGRDLLHQAAVPGLRLGQSRLGLPSCDHRPGVVDRDDRHRLVQPADPDLSGELTSGGTRDRRFEGDAGVGSLDPAGDHLEDVEPDGIAAEEGDGLVVRELDAMVPDHEEGLRGGREQALGIEAGDRRGGFLLDHPHPPHRVERIAWRRKPLDPTQGCRMARGNASLRAAPGSSAGLVPGGGVVLAEPVADLAPHPADRLEALARRGVGEALHLRGDQPQPGALIAPDALRSVQDVGVVLPELAGELHAERDARDEEDEGSKLHGRQPTRPGGSRERRERRSRRPRAGGPRRPHWIRTGSLVQPSPPRRTARARGSRGRGRGRPPPQRSRRAPSGAPGR